MVLFPEVQRQAQEELDTIIGSHRFPTWEDVPNLPYVMSCVKESFRCTAVDQPPGDYC